MTYGKSKQIKIALKVSDVVLTNVSYLLIILLLLLLLL